MVTRRGDGDDVARRGGLTQGEGERVGSEGRRGAGGFTRRREAKLLARAKLLGARGASAGRRRADGRQHAHAA